MTVVLRAEARGNDVWQRIGTWLASHQRHIRRTQWSMVAVYGALLVVPALLPLPDHTATLWNNVTRFAQFGFWGIWWPFVLLSTALVGRVWCGLLCPEGSLSELASRHGRGGAIPRWLQWPGWPTIGFAGTTLYGQMISVYQYPKPALLILGGSTAAAVVIGFLYGKNKRVWCRFLCPVSGVFGLLAKLAPLHFRVEPDLWSAHQRGGRPPGTVNCAPLVALKTMRGGSDCHMCGRCSGFRGAIRLARRSPSHEIIYVAGEHPKPWETVLIVFGLMGVAAGGFQWSASPWLISAKQTVALALIDNGLIWPLQATAPWWVLTNYPAGNDVLTLLDGGLLVGYIVATALVAGTAIMALLAAATACLGGWRAQRFHHLAQALIPLAAAGVFLGLSAMTVTQLRMDGIDLPLLLPVRAAFLALATAWSLCLAWRISGLYAVSSLARGGATASVAAALAVADAGWFLLFWLW